MLWHPVPVSEDSLHKRERQECSHHVEKPAGYYEVIWDRKDASGRHTASGVYLYRLKAGANWKVQKMVLLK